MQTLRPEKAAATSGKVQRRLERLSLLVRFTSAPASIRAFTTSSRPLVTANSRGLVNAPLLTSKPDSRRALTAGKLPDSAANTIGSASQSIPVSTKCAFIFASIDRTPPTLHTARLNDLLTCAKLSVPKYRAWGVPRLRTSLAAPRRGRRRPRSRRVGPYLRLGSVVRLLLRVSMAALEVAGQPPKAREKATTSLGAAERNFENNLQVASFALTPRSGASHTRNRRAPAGLVGRTLREMVVIEDDSVRMDTVCQPLQVRPRPRPSADRDPSNQPTLARCPIISRQGPDLTTPHPLPHPRIPQYHAGASVTKVVGTSNFPPSFAAVGYAPCFKGFG